MGLMAFGVERDHCDRISRKPNEKMRNEIEVFYQRLSSLSLKNAAKVPRRGLEPPT